MNSEKVVIDCSILIEIAINQPRAIKFLEKL
jgi:hypothetical protein